MKEAFFNKTTENLYVCIHFLKGMARLMSVYSVSLIYSIIWKFHVPKIHYNGNSLKIGIWAVVSRGGWMKAGEASLVWGVNKTFNKFSLQGFWWGKQKRGSELQLLVFGGFPMDGYCSKRDSFHLRNYLDYSDHLKPHKPFLMCCEHCSHGSAEFSVSK